MSAAVFYRPKREMGEVMANTDEDGGRTRMGNTPTCEDCGESLEGCTCGDDENNTKICPMHGFVAVPVDMTNCPLCGMELVI